MKTSLTIFFSLFLACAGNATAMAQGTHQSRSELRAYTAGNMFVTQEAQYSHNNISISGSKGDNLTKTMDGYALKVATGVEHLKCLHTSIVYSNVTEGGDSISALDYRANEIGPDVRLVFASPLLNVAFGGGAFVSLGTMKFAGQQSNFNGFGYYGSGDLTYFVSSKMNLIFSAAAVITKNKSKNTVDFMESSSSKTLRAGLGFTFWM